MTPPPAMLVPKRTRDSVPVTREGNGGRHGIAYQVSGTATATVTRFEKTKAQYRYPSQAITIPTTTPVKVEAIWINASAVNRICRFNKAVCWIVKPLKKKVLDRINVMGTSRGSRENHATSGELAARSKLSAPLKATFIQNKFETCAWVILSL